MTKLKYQQIRALNASANFIHATASSVLGGLDEHRYTLYRSAWCVFLVTTAGQDVESLNRLTEVVRLRRIIFVSNSAQVCQQVEAELRT